MPTEIRQITFKGPEAILAITEYHRRRSMAMPIGTALSIAFKDDGNLLAEITIQLSDGRLSSFRISSELLAAALILFCINRKIPLPADADKRLQAIGTDAIALIVIKRSVTK